MMMIEAPSKKTTKPTCGTNDHHLLKKGIYDLFTRNQQVFIILLPLILFMPFAAWTQQDSTSLQQENTLLADSLESTAPLIPFQSAIYYSQGYEFSAHLNGSPLSRQYGMGLEMAGFKAGFVHAKNRGKINEDPFFPRDFDLPYQYLGVVLGKRLIGTPHFSTYLCITYSQGDMAWREETFEDHIFSDRFRSWEPELQFTYLPWQYIQLFGDIGYRKVNDLSLTEVPTDILDGFTFSFGFRIGYFYQPLSK